MICKEYGRIKFFVWFIDFLKELTVASIMSALTMSRTLCVYSRIEWSFLMIFAVTLSIILSFVDKYYHMHHTMITPFNVHYNISVTQPHRLNGGNSGTCFLPGCTLPHASVLYSCKHLNNVGKVYQLSTNRLYPLSGYGVKSFHYWPWSSRSLSYCISVAELVYKL